MKEIIIADSSGFCYGVRRAVNLAKKTSANENVFSYGDLVHNEQVIKEMKDLGVVPLEDLNIEDSIIITRSHGIHKKEKELLEEKGNDVVDCVCPSVAKIYKIVKDHFQNGYQVIIIGKKDHPEVIGINSYCDDQGIIIETLQDIDRIPKNHPLCIVSQTTNEKEFFKNAIDRILEVFTKEVLVYNTICNATRKRQENCAEVAKKVEVMIVLGGKHSSNTSKLAEVAKKYCKNVYYIQSIEDVDINIFKEFNKIGITAGASTPDSVIKEAVSSMENLNKEEMNNEMMEAIDNSFTRVRRGEIVSGEVLFVTEDEVMVNINYRADGIIAKEELSSDPSVKPADLFKPGDDIQVYVIKMDDGDGNVVLSYKRVENMKIWDEMEQKFNDQEKVTAHIKSVVKGGLTCDVEGLNGFIPASHASIRYQKDLEKYVGTDMVCVIIDFDKSKRKFVLSRKKVEMEELEEKRKEVYSKIAEGDVIEGTVQRLTNFGAFVDVGGVDGLIHISELSWNRVQHPSDVVSPGEKIQVQVLNVDEEKNRIALGLKQTTEKPWDVFTSSVKVGDVVEGTIVNLLEFGAFVRLKSGVDGLLHVSQISRDHVDKPSDRLSIGDEITVKVTDINNEDQKISLSMKALMEEEPVEEEEEPVQQEEEPEERVEEEPVEPKDTSSGDFEMSIGDILNLKEQND